MAGAGRGFSATWTAPGVSKKPCPARTTWDRHRPWAACRRVTAPETTWTRTGPGWECHPVVSPALKSIRTLTTFEGCLRSMSIGPGTSAAASGVTIGSPEADGADEGGGPAAAGLSPSGLNAIAAPAAATSAARRIGLTSLMDLLSLCCGRSGERPGPSRSRRDTFAHTYRALSGSAQGRWGRLRVASGEGGCRGRQIETMAGDTGVGIRLLGGFEAT